MTADSKIPSTSTHHCQISPGAVSPISRATTTTTHRATKHTTVTNTARPLDYREQQHMGSGMDQRKLPGTTKLTTKHARMTPSSPTPAVQQSQCHANEPQQTWRSKCWGHCARTCTVVRRLNVPVVIHDHFVCFFTSGWLLVSLCSLRLQDLQQEHCICSTPRATDKV